MQFRELGKCGVKVSALGFGCMRLPTLDQGTEDIPHFMKPVDEDKADEMIQYAHENGINYYDTAYIYHGGDSEKFLGKALKPFRNDVMIATKLPCFMVQQVSDMDRLMDEQLQRLQTDYIDIYLLHYMNRHIWPIMKELGVLNFLEKIKSDGRAKHVGFSFHDDTTMFKEIIDSYDWDMCQIQYNYFDEDRQAGRQGLQYAADKGIGVVIMEPLRGGTLTAQVPKSVQEIWDSAPVKRTPAEWGLRWVFNHPEVSLVLSGMSAMEQLKENVQIVQDATPGSLSEEERETIKKAREKYEKLLKVDCTGCAYCMPCPNGVDIPMNFSLYNDVYMFDKLEGSQMMYNMVFPESARASACVECGECEEKCPQQIKIPEKLKDVHRVLGQNT